MKRGTEYFFKYKVNGKPKEVKIFQIKHLNGKSVDWSKVDEIPNTRMFTMSGTELLRSISAETCEYCSSKDNVEVHHVKKMKDLKGKQLWEKVMISMKRKQLVLCFNCHHQLHAGKLPNVVAIHK